MGGNGKHRWKISFSHHHNRKPKHTTPPKEFLCPISGSLMFDPVVVASGQTFERLSVQVCLDLNFTPFLHGDPDHPCRPDFSTLIPNLAMKSTIASWCADAGSDRPAPLDYSAIEAIVRAKKAAATPRMPISSPDIGVSERELLRGVAENPPVLFSHAETELNHRANHFYSSSSEESVVVDGNSSSSISASTAAAAVTPLPLATRPACYSSPSSSAISSSEIQEIETLTLTGSPTPNFSLSFSSSLEEDEITSKLNSPEVHAQEAGVVFLRKLTRTTEASRTALCNTKLLASLRPLITSRYAVVQTNAIAALVNLSLERPNKVTIVRSGFVTLLVDVLKSGSDEGQEHAAGALFSLSIEDENKMAIGVLGALQPLMHTLLRSDSEGARHDSALALYHLSLVQSNRVKLVKLGAVPTLLGMVKAGESASKVLLVLCNLASCNEGRSAMLDANAVGILVGMLREDMGGGNAADSESKRENCVAALFALSHGSMRFRGLAREARAVEVLLEIEESGSQRAREKAKRILIMMRGRGGEDEEESNGGSGDWEGRMEAEGISRTRYRGPVVGTGKNKYGPNSSNF